MAQPTIEDATVSEAQAQLSPSPADSAQSVVPAKRKREDGDGEGDNSESQQETTTALDGKQIVEATGVKAALGGPRLPPDSQEKIGYFFDVLSQ